MANSGTLPSITSTYDSRDYSIELHLPPLALIVLKYMIVRSFDFKLVYFLSLKHLCLQMLFLCSYIRYFNWLLLF
jgi:hypothetical protein